MWQSPNISDHRIWTGRVSSVFQLLVGAEEEGAQRRGRDGCRIMFPKVVFLGAPENSLGEKASEIFANIQQGDK